MVKNMTWGGGGEREREPAKSRLCLRGRGLMPPTARVCNHGYVAWVHNKGSPRHDDLCPLVVGLGSATLHRLREWYSMEG